MAVLTPEDQKLVLGVVQQAGSIKIDLEELAAYMSVKKPAASMRWSRFKAKLGQPSNDNYSLTPENEELVLGVIQQAGNVKINLQELATYLGIKKAAASMRWSRFKAKLGQATPTKPAGGQHTVNSQVKKPGRAKRGVEEDDGYEALSTPSKKARVARPKQKMETRDEESKFQGIEGDEADDGKDGDNDGFDVLFNSHPEIDVSAIFGDEI
ncbi:hypothetical protein B7494_g3886 [Chlorociboria aeruginascens]|nr:hypothetical protein B7494_g3886 [Chlorociboria aeruginascens]